VFAFELAGGVEHGVSRVWWLSLHAS